MHNEQDILETLKKNGSRLTKARRAIVHLLLSQQKPWSALDLHKELKKKKLPANKVTVYRELQFLAGEGILHALTFDDGIVRYELPDGHRHHLICTHCKSIQDIEMEHDLDHIEKLIRQQKSFHVARHSLEFYGLCARCS